jgi:hypothetical protein
LYRIGIRLRPDLVSTGILWILGMDALSLSRQYLKGWSANKSSEAMKVKDGEIRRMAELDSVSDSQVVGVDHWNERYKLEAKLEQILHKEELYWQQRSGTRWLLQGDANTAFFHSSANGRRK